MTQGGQNQIMRNSLYFDKISHKSNLLNNISCQEIYKNDEEFKAKDEYQQYSKETVFIRSKSPVRIKTQNRNQPSKVSPQLLGLIMAQSHG